MTIVEIRMAKDALRNDGLGRGRIEVARQVKVGVDDNAELSNEEGRDKSWQSGVIDERKEAEMEEGGCGDMDGVKGCERKEVGRR